MKTDYRQDRTSGSSLAPLWLHRLYLILVLLWLPPLTFLMVVVLTVAGAGAGALTAWEAVLPKLFRHMHRTFQKSWAGSF